MIVSEKNERAFGLVLDEVAKSALRTIDLAEDEDGNTLFLMGQILVGLCGNESDDLIAAKSLGYLMMRGFVIPEEKVKEIAALTREKCQMQILGLRLAYNSINEFGATGEEALASIQQFI